MGRGRRLNLPILDELQLLALTVYQEASGEPWPGVLAVAWVVMNRVHKHRTSVHDEVFRPMQFSCWNGDSPTRRRLDTIDPNGAVWRESYKAAALAFFDIGEDPSRRADHYLNPELVKATAGHLPTWYDPKKVVASYGRHEFLRLWERGTG